MLGHDLERGGRFGAVRARLDGRHGLRRGEVENGPPDTRGGVVAEQPRERRVDLQDAAVAVDRQRLRRGVGQPSVAVLRGAQGLLGPGSLGDLAARALEQMGVVERERRELGEALEHVDLALAEGQVQVARRQPEDTQDRPLGDERDADDRADQPDGQARVARRQGVVVGHDERTSRRPDGPGHPGAARQPVADVVALDPDPEPHHELVRQRIDEVQVAVRRPDEVRRTLDDRPEQLGRVEPVHQRDRRLVEGGQIGVGEGGPLRVGRTMGRLAEVEPDVGHLDEGVLRSSVGREGPDPDADRDEGTGIADLVRGGLRHGRPDPLGDRLGLGPIEARQDHGELVAPVAVGPIAVAQRPDDRLGHRAQERVPGRVAVRVVERLERVEVHHQQRQARAVVGRDGLAELALECAVVAQAGQRVELGPDLDRPGASAFWRAIDACPANSFVSSNSFASKCDSSWPIRPMFKRADDLAAHPERHDDHRLGLLGRPGDLDRARVEVGVVGQDGLVPVDDPAGDPDPRADRRSP